MRGENPSVDEKEFLAKQFPDLVFLESEWEFLHIRIWINSRTDAGFGAYVNAETVYMYCENFGLNKVETIEVINQINQGANSVKKP